MIGMDSEHFIQDGNTVVSVYGHVGGTKQVPLKVNKGTLQEDGVAAEIGTDPVNNPYDFYSNIVNVKNQLNERLRSKGLSLADSLSTANFTREELSGEQGQLGCERDYNAWTKQFNPRPSKEYAGLLRTCGGHVHVSWDNSITNPWEVIKYMDLFLGIPSVILDNDMTRRKLYGTAGACRIRDYPNGQYGVEYRTLSNFWTEDEKLVHWVFNGAQRALASAVVPFRLQSASLMQAIINNYDKESAQDLIDKYEVEMP